MNFTGFKEKDFKIFQIDGLGDRMEAIQSHIQPKFEEISKRIAPELALLTGEDMHTHIAKHARRTVNPPNDTWVAFSDSRRGYKKHPHFQFGLWGSHLFIWFALIYESPYKEDAARAYAAHADRIYSSIPDSFCWSSDHMKPDVKPQNKLSKDGFKHLVHRLGTVKKAELLCGKVVPRESAVELNDKELIEMIQDTYKTVLPLYKMAKSAVMING